MEELKLKFVKVFVLIRSYKFNPPLLQAFNNMTSGCLDLSNLPMGTIGTVDTIRVQSPTPGDSSPAAPTQLYFGDWEAKARQAGLKPNETFYHIDRQRALEHKEELERDSVPDYDVKVELSEYVGLIDDEAKTVRVITSWNAQTLS